MTNAIKKTLSSQQRVEIIRCWLLLYSKLQNIKKGVGNRIKILSLDQSSVKTGYAIFESDKLVRYGLINLSKEKDLSIRFESMCREIQKLIQSVLPDIVLFEDVALQTNPSTLTILSRIQGAIIQSCLFSRVPYIIYKPSSWRKILMFHQGKGVVRKQLKEQALAYIKDRYNINVSEDIAEAICIGSTYIKQNNIKGEN